MESSAGLHILCEAVFVYCTVFKYIGFFSLSGAGKNCKNRTGDEAGNVRDGGGDGAVAGRGVRWAKRRREQ